MEAAFERQQTPEFSCRAHWDDDEHWRPHRSYGLIAEREFPCRGALDQNCERRRRKYARQQDLDRLPHAVPPFPRSRGRISLPAETRAVNPDSRDTRLGEVGPGPRWP